MLGILMDSDDRACWCASMLRISLPRRNPGRYEQILVVTVETANMPTPLSPTGEEAKATTTRAGGASPIAVPTLGFWKRWLAT